ncbi:MAG: hypothetical protein QM775_09550 [Pirellulales bacterium]
MKSGHPSRVAFVCLGGVCLAVVAWQMLRSAQAQTVAPPASGQFEMAYAQLYDKNLCETVMFHTGTGQAWQRVGLTWKKIEEPAPLAPGRYRVELVPSRHDGYRSFRVDQLTGQCWYIKEGKWAAFEPLERTAGEIT